MPTEVTTTYYPARINSWTTQCGNTTYGAVTPAKVKSQTSRVYNGTIRRHKPELLASNPTGLSKQTTDTLRVGEKQYVTLSNTYCAGKLVMKGRSDFSRSLNDPINVLSWITPTSGNWNLDLLAKIEDQSQNLGGMMYEFRETCGTVSKAATELANSYRVIRQFAKSGKIGGVRKTRYTAKDLTDLHLQLAFGVKPTIEDVFNSAMILKNRLERDPCVTIRTRTVNHIHEERTTADTSWKTTRTYDGKVVDKCKAYVTFKADSLGNFSMGNPLEWAWELTTLSFLADYLFPIGATLNALDALKGVKNITGTRTTRVNLQHLMVVDLVPHALRSLIYSQPGVATHESHVRTLLSLGSIPITPTQLYTPSSSIAKLNNCFALLRSQRGQARAIGLTPLTKYL